MQLKTEPYLNQKERWQPRGKVILAQYDADSIVVYQAYRPSIGHFAAEHGFDTILAQAVHSKYIPDIYKNEQAWSKAIKHSDVRLQWDPDHTPIGEKVERRAIQLGLQGEAAIRYSQEWIVGIEDISEFVAEQRQHIISRNYTALLTPSEYVYEVTSLETAKKLQLSAIGNSDT